MLFKIFTILGSIMFFLTMFLMDGPIERPEETENKPSGVDNRAYTHDEPRRGRSENARL